METIDWTPGFRDALSRAFAHHHDMNRVRSSIVPEIGCGDYGILLTWKSADREFRVLFSSRGFLHDVYSLEGPNGRRGGTWPPVQWQNMILYWLAYGNASEAASKETTTVAAYMNANFHKMLQEFETK